MAELFKQMFRYAVPVDDRPHTFELAGEPLKVAAAYIVGSYSQGVEFWAEWHRSLPTATRTFQVFGTGHHVPVNAVWRGTCDRTPDGLVWHLYELPGEGR